MIPYENEQETIRTLLSEEKHNEGSDVRRNYMSLLEVSRLLLKQVSHLSLAFRTLELPGLTEELRQSTIKKISETLEVCDILRTAADLGKSPNDMIGYYLLGAKHQAESLAVSREVTCQRLESPDSVARLEAVSIGEDRHQDEATVEGQVLELSMAAEKYASQQREEMTQESMFVDGELANGGSLLVPLIETKRYELSALETDLSEQIKELRDQFDSPIIKGQSCQ